MTRDEFYEKHCMICGTQRCPRDNEAISTCGYYKGDIKGIEKKETLNELLARIKKRSDK